MGKKIYVLGMGKPGREMQGVFGNVWQEIDAGTGLYIRAGNLKEYRRFSQTRKRGRINRNVILNKFKFNG